MKNNYNSKKILTISIAAYNMEKYIKHTMDSIIDERIIDDIEIFVIDDGGTDNTLNIAREYAKQYPESIIPVHKDNGGYGSTVNYSIANASGKYFKLLDGDDWFDKEYLFDFIHFLKNTDADIIITPYKYGVSEKNLEINISCPLEKNKIYKTNEISEPWSITMWTLTTKIQPVRSQWSNLPLKSFYTDVLYVLYAIAHSNTIIYFDSPIYCYRKDREGNSTNKKSIAMHYMESWEIAKISAQFYENEKSHGSLNTSMLLLRATQTCAGTLKALVYRSVSCQTIRLIKQYDNEIKNISKDVYYAMERNSKVGKLIKLLRIIGL